MENYKIYLLEQSHKTGYDTYDSCVVSSLSESEAKLFSIKYLSQSSWTHNLDYIYCTEIGISNLNKQEMICASFNAG